MFSNCGKRQVLPLFAMYARFYAADNRRERVRLAIDDPTDDPRDTIVRLRKASA